MTKDEAIKYLQQLYPNGGHCWLDEQRIEAIGMAIKALQEEPVSEELEEAVNAYIGYAPEIDESLSTYGKRQAFKAGAQWYKEQMMAKAIDGDITFDYDGYDDKTYGCIAHDSFCLEDLGLKDTDKVKIIIIKED